MSKENCKGKITRKIGNTTYHVSISFSQTSKENINDKLVRLIRNEGSTPKVTAQ